MLMMSATQSHTNVHLTFGTLKLQTLEDLEAKYYVTGTCWGIGRKLILVKIGSVKLQTRGGQEHRAC